MGYSTGNTMMLILNNACHVASSVHSSDEIIMDVSVRVVWHGNVHFVISSYPCVKIRFFRSNQCRKKKVQVHPGPSSSVPSRS